MICNCIFLCLHAELYEALYWSDDTVEQILTATPVKVNNNSQSQQGKSNAMIVLCYIKQLCFGSNSVFRYLSF